MKLSLNRHITSGLCIVSLLFAVTFPAVAETIEFAAQRATSTFSSNYRIYVPPAIETPRIKGVVFFYGGSGGDWRYRAEDPIWQDAVRSLGFALICADANGFGSIPQNSLDAPTALANILAAAATATGHGELVNVPVAITGVSLGGWASTLWALYNPSRMICIVPQRGALSNTSSAATREVHTLFIPGSFDDNGATKPTVLRTHFNFFRSSTTPDGRAAWAVDWGSYHDPFTKNQSWAMAWSWIAESIALRYPPNTLPSTVPGNPVLLNTVPLENGWLGHQAFVPPDTTGADYSTFDQIAPYNQYVGDKNVASWLPNETTARVYRAMNSRDSGYWTRTVIPLQRSLAIMGDAAPLATVPGQTDIPQLATWEAGATINFTVDPREFDDVNPISSLEYYDGVTLLATQTQPGSGGVWNLPYTLHTVGIHSLTVVATDSVGNKASAFRPVVVAPVRDRGTSHWRFESNPHRVTDQHDNLTLWESSTVAWRPVSIALPASGPGSKFPDFNNEYGTNTQALQLTAAQRHFAPGADIPLFTNGTNREFTFEACVNLATTDAGGAWRIIASHGGAHATDMGWQLAVSSETSGRGPRNLVLQTSQTGAGSAMDTIDSDLQLQLGVDYYIAVAYNPADTSAAGATFYLKDLTNNGPLQVAHKTHSFTSLWDSGQIFTIGSAYYSSYWDGLIDEVRFTNRLRPQAELLISNVRTPYQQWLAANGYPINTPTAGDLDNDGIQNLMEYALGLPEGTSGYQEHYSQSVVDHAGGDYLALAYIHPEPAPGGITYTVQASPDLAAGNWSSLGLVELSSTVSAGLRTVTVRDSVPLTGASKRFMRLLITQP